jgi:hypothetical protein
VGQTFRADAPDTGTGIVRMSEYARDGWEHWGSNYTHDPIYHTSVLPSGTTISFWFDYWAGTGIRYPSIMVPLGAWRCELVDPTDPGTKGMTIVGGNLTGANGNTLTARVDGVTVNQEGAVNSFDVTGHWFDGTPPPPDGADYEYELRAEIDMSTAPVTGFDTIEFDIVQPADAGGFNGELRQRVVVDVARRGTGRPDLDVEWYADAGYSTLLGTDAYLRFMVGPQSGNLYGQVWVRYRIRGAPAWTDYARNPTQWWDPRYYNQYPEW